MTSKEEQKIIDKAISDYEKRYNELYEILYQDTQWGVEYIMELENRIKQLEMLCDDIEDKLKQLKTK